MVFTINGLEFGFVLMSQHQFINDAKASQADHLRKLAAYLKQLQRTVARLVEANSTSTAVLDKIDTIHAVNRQIDHQLNDEIATNYGELVQAQTRLEKMATRTEAALGGGKVVEECQHHLEMIDTQLRILEHTLQYVQQRHSDGI